MEPATVVIDNGTGFTKMGYAGNMEPSYIIPTRIATNETKVRPLDIPLICILRFLRNQLQEVPQPQNSWIMNWISTLETQRILVLQATIAEVYWNTVKLLTGRESKNSGTSRSTTTFVASQKSTNSSWRSHQWTPQRTESKWRKLCSRPLMLRDSSLACKQLSLCMLKSRDQTEQVVISTTWQQMHWLVRSLTLVMVSPTCSQSSMDKLLRALSSIFLLLVVILLPLSEIKWLHVEKYSGLKTVTRLQ